VRASPAFIDEAVARQGAAKELKLDYFGLTILMFLL
jgi:hypothetical protein